MANPTGWGARGIPGAFHLTKRKPNPILSDPPRDLPRPVAGVDEAGRGPLAGPVVAAAVLAPDGWDLEGLDDSKKLKASIREELASRIRQCPGVHWGVGIATAQEIDQFNILQATFLAMRRAVEALGMAPSSLAVDGNQKIPRVGYPQQPIVEGDAKVRLIAAASILAKTVRDDMMLEYDREYPGYGFSVHKGYPTKAHLLSLQALGVSPIHRRSFGPVRLRLEQTEIFAQNSSV